jgi:hypothetical protein
MKYNYSPQQNFIISYSLIYVKILFQYEFLLLTSSYIEFLSSQSRLHFYVMNIDGAARSSRVGVPVVHGLISLHFMRLKLFASFC